MSDRWIEPLIYSKLSLLARVAKIVFITFERLFFNLDQLETLVFRLMKKVIRETGQVPTKRTRRQASNFTIGKGF